MRAVPCIHRLILTLFAAGFLLAVACGPAENGRGPASAGDAARFSGEYPIRIVTTTGMIADLAREIGGDRVQAQALMGPGVDPHLYKVSTDDVSKLRSADMILYNGLHLEGKM